MVFRKICAGSFATVFRNKYTTSRLRSPANMFLLRIFVLRYNSTLSGFFHSAFHRLLLFTKKYFSHQTFRTCRLRQENHTMKTKLNKSLLVRRKKVSVAVRQTILGCVIRKATFGTQKLFHNKQYTPKSKDQPLKSAYTHFYVRLDNSNVAMHRPTIIFLLSHKITTVQQKTTGTRSQPFNKNQNKIT